MSYNYGIQLEKVIKYYILCTVTSESMIINFEVLNGGLHEEYKGLQLILTHGNNIRDIPI